MTPACIYIDGLNLYHGIFYFSAFAHWLPDNMARHEMYVRALSANGVTCILGHFKNKDRKCNSCGATWVAHEEKETDVSIRISMLNDAYKGRYDKAYLVTRDSDLMPAVRMVRAEYPTKHIVAVAPPLMGHSNDLIAICHSKKKISPKQIRACLLPQKIYQADGTLAAVRPTKYD